MKARHLWLGVLLAACSGGSEGSSSEGGPEAAPFDATARDGSTADAPSDAGIEDAPSDGDAPKDSGIGTGGPSKCGGSTYRLCDGFEESSIDTSLWKVVTLNGTVEIDSTHVARGKSALHSHTGLADAADYQNSVAALDTTHNFPFPNDDIWGRVFVYVANKSPEMHTDFFEAVGDFPDTYLEAHYRLGANLHFLSGNYIPGDYPARSATIVPLNQWSCYEWNFDGGKNEYNFYLNGAEVPGMTVLADAQPPWIAPPFKYFELGLRLYHTLAEPLDLWYDEVALDTSRITCAK